MERSLSEIEIFNLEPGLRGVVDLIRVQCGPGKFTPPTQDVDSYSPGGWLWGAEDGRTIDIEVYTDLGDLISIYLYDLINLWGYHLSPDQEVYPTLALADLAARWFLSPR